MNWFDFLFIAFSVLAAIYGLTCIGMKITDWLSDLFGWNL